MGWAASKVNKAIKSTNPEQTSRVSFGTRGRNELPPSNKPPIERPIEGYDYKPEDHSNKGHLRREKLRKEANSIYESSELSQDEKKFQLQRLIDSEKIHQNKFKPDTERKNYLRDQRLGKTDKNSQFDEYTDGTFRTKK
jgi:hypothetical protein